MFKVIAICVGLVALVGLVWFIWRSDVVRMLRAIRLERRGVTILNSGQVDRAKRILEKSVDLAESAAGSDDADVAPIVANLAQAYWWSEEQEKAEELYQRAIRIREAAVGDDDPFLILIYHNYAEMLRGLGRFADANEIDEKATAIQEKHPDMGGIELASTGIIGRYGIVEDPDGWREEMDRANAIPSDPYNAETHVRTALRVAMEHDPKGPHVVESLLALGGVLFKQGKQYDAAGAYRSAKEICEPGIPTYSQILNNLAVIHIDLQEYNEALECLEEAAETEKDLVGEEHPDYATVLHNLGGLFQDWGDPAKAKDFYARALEIRKKSLPRDDPQIASTQNCLAIAEGGAN